MTTFLFDTEEIARLLAGREGRTDPVTERLRWFRHFTLYRSVSGTCQHFQITRTTFYRWARRFDPADLTTLENRPTVLVRRFVCSDDHRLVPMEEQPAAELSAGGHEARESPLRPANTGEGGTGAAEAGIQPAPAAAGTEGTVQQVSRSPRTTFGAFDRASLKRALVIGSILANAALLGFFLSTVLLESHRASVRVEASAVTPIDVTSSLPTP